MSGVSAGEGVGRRRGRSPTRRVPPLAWAFLLSPLSFPPGSEPAPIYSNRPLAITFPLVVLVHVFLSLLHSPLVLPRIGVHTAAYVGLLVGLGGFFTSLGLWGANARAGQL